MTPVDVADRPPLRFGVLTKGAPTRAAWHDLLARVQGTGFGSLLVPVHSTPQFAPFVALADAAARTTLRLGTLVHNNDLEHPVLLAREATTLALLSESRFELGIGAGWMERDYRQLGLAMDGGGARVTRLAEAIQILRRCWSGEEFSFHGERYHLDDVRGLPGPVPLLVGAGAPRMLQIAADTADVVSFGRDFTAGSTPHDVAVDASMESTERKADVVRGRLGTRAAAVELNILVVRVTAGGDARAALDRYVASTGVDERTALETPQSLLAASPQQMREMVAERRDRTGINYFVFREEDLDRVGPLVEHLAGT